MSVLGLRLTWSDKQSTELNILAGWNALRPQTRATLYTATNMLVCVWGALTFLMWNKNCSLKKLLSDEMFTSGYSDIKYSEIADSLILRVKISSNLKNTY